MQGRPKPGEPAFLSLVKGICRHTDVGEQGLIEISQADDRKVIHVAGLAKLGPRSQSICNMLNKRNDVKIDVSSGYHGALARDFPVGRVTSSLGARVIVADLIAPQANVAQLKFVEAREEVGVAAALDGVPQIRRSEFEHALKHGKIGWAANDGVGHDLAPFDTWSLRPANLNVLGTTMKEPEMN